MKEKSKEKHKNKNTKDKNKLNLDNEIVIGIRTLSEPKKNKKTNNKIKKTDKNTINNKNIQKKQKLNLGVEDETIKKQTAKKNRKVTKQQEIAKNKRKIIFNIIKYSILLIILISGAICFMLSPFFYIKEITTTGNIKITSEELISLSGIELEQNTFKIRKKQVQEKIKQNAYVNEVNVKRKLPGKIEIIITERIPTFMLTFANAYVYINNQGYLLEVSKISLNIPIITGFLTPEEDIHVGNRLCSEDLQRLEQVLQIMKSAESNGISELITQINISDKQNYILKLETEKKTVHLGDNSNLSTKMLYIISIIEENKDVEGEIFVNTDLNNKGAIFRKRI